MIKVIHGPMGAGKSSELLRLERRAIVAGHKCVSIKYAGDTRYDEIKITTHDNIRSITATIPVVDLADVILPAGTHLVLIDEAQFIKNVAYTCVGWINTGAAKEIAIAMLNADYMSRPFDNAAEIYAVADNTIFLSAVCKCGNDASRTVRLTQESEREIIGGFDKYSPCCRPCMLKNSVE